MNTRAAGAGSPLQVRSVAPEAEAEDLEPDTPYLATVNGVVKYGAFVDLNERLSGLIHQSNLDGEVAVGDEVVVELVTVHEDGDIAFDHVPVEEFEVVQRRPTTEATPISELAATSDRVTIEGRIEQIKQTGGPTVFTISDGEGLLRCAAFEAAGVRAYPELALGDFVAVTGPVNRRNEGLQLEVDQLHQLAADRAESIADQMESRIADRAQPPEIDPLIEWDALEKMWPELRSIAETLRRMILENRPVRFRHHADGDGMCAAVPLTLALERYARETHRDPTAARHLVRRSPSKAPYYELEDGIRDLNRALEDRSRHGQRLPMLVMLDNGSTTEDVPAYRNLAHYDIPIAVIDHHHPDPEVDELLNAHVNPYHHDEDYRVTTGMLCVELARLIAPAITDRVRHLPAVAGLADRSEADEMATYFTLAADAGFDADEIDEIGDALDYTAHWLRYRPGERLVRDVLGLEGESDTGPAARSLLAERARRALDRQREDALAHVATTSLPNGARLHRIDLEAHAHRFEYPAPGKTTGALHDHLAAETGEPTITMGYGPDFVVLRSDGVRLDIPSMVEELRAEYPGGGVSGGGHLVVGSLSFVTGRRETVLSALEDRMGAAAIDEELTSTAEVAGPDEST